MKIELCRFITSANYLLRDSRTRWWATYYHGEVPSDLESGSLAYEATSRVAEARIVATTNVDKLP